MLRSVVEAKFRLGTQVSCIFATVVVVATLGKRVGSTNDGMTMAFTHDQESEGTLVSVCRCCRAYRA